MKTPGGKAEETEQVRCLPPEAPQEGKRIQVECPPCGQKAESQLPALQRGVGEYPKMQVGRLWSLAQGPKARKGPLRVVHPQRRLKPPSASAWQTGMKASVPAGSQMQTAELAAPQSTWVAMTPEDPQALRP